MQHDPRQGVHRPVVAVRRTGPGAAGQVQRRGLVHERQRHELGEPTGAVLDAGQHPQVAHPVPRRVDVSVHHRRTGAQPHLVRGGDDLDPLRGGQLALGQHPAHLVVEDLGGGARNGVQAGFSQRGQPLPNARAALGHPVDDLHRRERVHVHRRHPGLDRTHQVGVARHRQIGVDPALHAHLGRAGDMGLPGPVGHLLGRQREGVGIAFPLRERTEPAAGVADVGEVDVAVDDVGDIVADGVAAQRVSQRRNSIECRTVGGGQRQVFVVGAAGGVTFGRAQGGQHIGVEAFGRAGGQLADLLPDGVPVTERAAQVAAGLRPAPLGVDRFVQVDPAQRFGCLVGFLPRATGRVDVTREPGLRVGQRGDVTGHPRIDPGCTGGDIGRLGGQPLDQVVTRLGGDRGQFVQCRPGPFGVDVVRGQRRHATPVVDPGTDQRQALRA